jgi:hypothetical protein
MLTRVVRRLTIQLGNLKTLPEDYTGPRHVVTAKQLPPDSIGRVWFEWEERPGPGPAEQSDRLSDEQIIRVCYVERNGLHSG